MECHLLRISSYSLRLNSLFPRQPKAPTPPPSCRSTPATGPSSPHGSLRWLPLRPGLETARILWFVGGVKTGGRIIQPLRCCVPPAAEAHANCSVLLAPFLSAPPYLPGAGGWHHCPHSLQTPKCALCKCPPPRDTCSH